MTKGPSWAKTKTDPKMARNTNPIRLHNALRSRMWSPKNKHQAQSVLWTHPNINHIAKIFHAIDEFSSSLQSRSLATLLSEGSQVLTPIGAFKLSMRHHTPVGCLTERMRLKASKNIVDGKIPTLDVGDHRLECRTRPTAKDIRTGSYDSTIVIS